ncbi:Bacteriophage HK97-gp10, putative tail-component [Microbacterium hydrothermale]|uniref:HK97 gp10 family phage protein n=1 Tax=Microbacterium hydrothermale TaxID=857427 RepID=UPI002226D34F|nr:HK97 gp10 family phage protein [Microbacterium hydrothermale]MCW2165068.1 Bacteriophage HK97-gp10, putative tail-component [Microbacterium hydrothermale]
MAAVFFDSALDELSRGDGVRGVVADAAHTVADIARADAPVASGEYRDSIHVEVAQTDEGVVATVVADVRHAMIVESREGTLARALGKAASRV